MNTGTSNLASNWVAILSIDLLPAPRKQSTHQYPKSELNKNLTSE
jgi:hypothetical protein